MASPSRRAAATRCSPACTRPTTTLPESLKKRIEGLKAEHAYGGRGARGNDLLEPEDRQPPAGGASRSCARHEETGRKSLYANPYHILRIQGLGDAESEKLIAELTDHMVATHGAVPPQVAGRRHRDLGQSLRAALGDRRLPDRGAAHPLAGHHHAGRAEQQRAA